MGSLEYNDFSTQADEVMTPNNAKVEMVNVGGQRCDENFRKTWLEMVCRHSNLWSAQKAAKQKHVSVIVEGSMTCRHDDGSENDL